MAYLYVALSQIIIGINIVMAKVLLPVFNIYLLLCSRFLIGTLILAFSCYVKKINPTIDSQGQRFTSFDWLVLFTQAMCGGFLFNVLMLSGLELSDATSAGIITSTTPAVILVLSYFILKEKLSVRRVSSVLLAVVGLLILSVGKMGQISMAYTTLWGDFLMLLAVVPEAFFTIIAKWYKRNVNFYALALIVCGYNALLFLPLSINHIVPLPTDVSLFQVILLLLYGYAGGALFFILWFKGISHIPASSAALITTLMPVSTTILAFVFLGEVFSTYEIFGMLLVLGSIGLGSFSFKRIKSKNILLD